MPDARANLAPIPDGLARRRRPAVPGHLFDRALRRRERQHPRRRRRRGVRAGADRAVRDARREAQGRVARSSASTRTPTRLAMARRFGANVTLNTERRRRRRGNQAADRMAAAWTSRSKRSAGRRRSRTRCARLGQAARSRASASTPGKLVAPYEAIYAGLGDQKIVTTLCPGGKERMRRLMAMVENRRVDLSPLVTHQFALDDIDEAFELFSHQRDGVLKVALYPSRAAMPVSARRAHDPVGVRA